jgi:hypothetical protein
MNEGMRYKKGTPFNAYFCDKLKAGFSVIDNQAKKEFAIVTILKLHQVFE